MSASITPRIWGMFWGPRCFYSPALGSARETSGQIFSVRPRLLPRHSKNALLRGIKLNSLQRWLESVRNGWNIDAFSAESAPMPSSGHRPGRRQIDRGQVCDQAPPVNSCSRCKNDRAFQATPHPILILEEFPWLNLFGASEAARNRRHRFSTLASSVKVSIFQSLLTQTSPPELRRARCATGVSVKVATGDVFTETPRGVLLA
jgi:hypothetical protein